MHLPHDPLLLFSVCLGSLDPETGGPEVEYPQCHQPRLVVVYSDYAGTLRDESRYVFFCVLSPTLPSGFQLMEVRVWQSENVVNIWEKWHAEFFCSL